MNKFAENIKKHAIEYGSIPFWCWNDRLKGEELIRQMHYIKDMGCRGFFMHARTGLETEYLSDEWYDCIKTCIDEAERLGLEAWAYDENGWPSGFAGGKLLEDPENHAVFVEGELCEKYPEIVENTYAVYYFDGNGIPRLTETVVDGASRYLHVTVGTDGSYVDTMRADVTDKFLEATHGEYKKKFPEDFGRGLTGFFTDEPQYYRWKTPFSKKMDEWFLDEYGYSVKEALPSLFCDYKGAEEFRYDYHKMTNRKFTENFSKRMYDWAENNGIRITGHFVEENSLRGQMMCCGDIMPQYLYEHIPGIDYLGRKLQTDLAHKQLGSVCAQTGRKKAISEMFGCCGWDVSPRELKHITELQYASGVNVTCQHLLPYSIRGERKRDYPNFYSEHNLWGKEMKNFNQYFNNLGYMLSMGEEVADTLVIHPIHSAWLKFKRIEMKTSVAELDGDFEALCYLLSGNGIGYHFGNEEIMKNLASVEDNYIRIGLCKYNKVVLPACDTLDKETVELLSQFMENGGKVYTYKHHLPKRIDGRLAELDIFGNCRDVTDADVISEILGSQAVILEYPENVALSDVRVMVRSTEYGRLIYITNLTGKDIYGINVKSKGSERLGKLDIAALDISAIRGRKTSDGVEAIIDLFGSESYVLCEYEAPDFLPYVESEPKKFIKLNSPFKVKDLPVNYITLDRARVSLNGAEPSELRPMERIRDELLYDRYCGKVTLIFPFELKCTPNKLELISETARVSEYIRVNGKKVKMGNDFAIDRSFRVTDIAPYVKEGANNVELDIDYYQSDYVYYVLYGGVSESLRNCLVFDTEIENVYLRGNFAVDTDPACFTFCENNGIRYSKEGGLALVAQRKDINAGNIVTDGYPFFAGEITFSTTVTHKKGDTTWLRLTGRYATAEISVNGKKVGVLLLSEDIDLKDFLCEGENELTVTLCNSYRNLMGPHHGEIAEPLSVNPKTFSFEKKWENGKCEKFNDGYAFVRFGIDS
ncbi:MAG: hypothetical protein E7607_04990 [Ruminococcaceae bacterium]|nr:hypothetical protein [Oscillospiraceae bacterium]